MSSTHPTPPPVQVSPPVGQPLQQTTPPARRDGVLAIDEANGDQPAQVARVDPDAWTVQRLRLWMIAAFTKSSIDSPQLCAEYLLCHVLGCKKLDLFSQPLRVLDPAQLATLRALVSRALKHEPVQYLIGAWSFYGVELLVDRRVLIPRPSTETIIDFVLSDAKSRHTVSNRLDAAMIGDDDRPIVIKPGSKAKSIAPLEIADVCTGSGAIALALAKHLPSATLTATDVWPDALAVAQANIDRSASKSRVSIAQGNLLE